MVQYSKGVVGLVALSGTVVVFASLLLKRVFPPKLQAWPPEDEDPSSPQSPNGSNQFVKIPRVQDASNIQDSSQEMMTTAGARQGGAGPSMDPFHMKERAEALRIQHNMQEMATNTRGARQITIPIAHPLRLDERHLSPILLEIFTSGFPSSGFRQLGRELDRLQQGQAWQGITGSVPVIALVYRIPTVTAETFSGFSIQAPDPFPDAAWRRQDYYAMKLTQIIARKTPQIVVQGSVSVGNVWTLPRLIPNVQRASSLGIQDAEFAFYHGWDTGSSWLRFSFRLNLRLGFKAGMLVMVAIYETETLCKCVRGENPGLDSITRKLVVKDFQLCHTVDSRFLERVVPLYCVTRLWKGFCRYNFGVVVFIQYKMEVCSAQHFICDQEVPDPHVRKYVFPNSSLCESKSL